MNIIIQRHLKGGVVEGGKIGQDCFQLLPWQFSGPVSIEKNSRPQRLGEDKRISGANPIPARGAR